MITASGCLPMTPIQRVLGFEAAEELYDTMPMREQLIVDLLMAGWNQTQIAQALDVSQSTISVSHKRIRYHLANSKLRVILESRYER